MLIEYEKYKNYTPEKVRKYIVDNKGCQANNGTYHSAILSTLRHYGFTAKEYDTMSDLWKALEKAPVKEGIILFSGGTKNGLTWTGGGHYIGFTGYKIKDGKHYLYMKDSGPRDHDGWYCYETYMNGLVSKVWAGYIKDGEVYQAPTKKVYSGSYPSAAVSTAKGTKTNIKYWQNFLNWWSDGDFFKECGAADGIFGTNTEK